MANEALSLLLFVLETARPALTAPGFENFRVLFSGWVLTEGTHAVTEALVQTRVAGRRHHEALHRFISRGAQNPADVGRLVFLGIPEGMAPGSALFVVLDDTLAPKKRQQIFCFGHGWVTLAVVMPVPFSTSTWALPVLFRLSRTMKDCERKGRPHRKKPEPLSRSPQTRCLNGETRVRSRRRSGRAARRP